MSWAPNPSDSGGPTRVRRGWFHGWVPRAGSTSLCEVRPRLPLRPSSEDSPGIAPDSPLPERRSLGPRVGPCGARSRYAQQAFPQFANIDDEVDPGGWRDWPGNVGSARRAAIVDPMSAGLGADQYSQPPDQTFGARLRSSCFPELSRPNGRPGTLTKAVTLPALSAGGTGRRRHHDAAVLPDTLDLWHAEGRQSSGQRAEQRGQRLRGCGLAHDGARGRVVPRRAGLERIGRAGQYAGRRRGAVQGRFRTRSTARF
jgi:hypothetical protein